MKKLLFALLILAGFSASAQADNPNYDKALAERLGADERGMKSYILAILKTGPNKVQDKAKVNELFRGHMDNIQRLSDEGKLYMAGPFGKNDKEYRGLYIFNVKTIEEAQALLETDPMIKENVLVAEMYPWYGSAGLGILPETHKKLTKNK